ncbi:PREDICTED: uncharacterized protein LOC108557042 [Nicrophorus vespilloides]|uniref:Uncharacterized protein LOC108557042 n=1 Tax=Nicrophorus vespilloides TaxID=110193 RepID=A0ABM1M2V6_NICVS|nr:PREDICTED: uncharacterized protein LOC108557042 [Nicrophorus vespilloides]
MDKTLELSEDSGFVSSLSYTSTSTPAECNQTSRKRRFSIITERKQAITNIASSTLNESAISRSFELCNISSFTPSYYVERSPEPPTTPIKSDVFYESHSKTQKTPPKHHYPSLQKLGSPESNKILYKDIKPNCIQKVLDAKVKRSSPAKKRLFSDARRKLSPLKLDPVVYFTVKRRYLDVLPKVYSYLSDADLYNCSRVSQQWKTSIKDIACAQSRLTKYSLKISINKENLIKRISLPMPTTKVIKKCDLQLNKCVRCNEASIVDRNIYQCQNTMCGYIYCNLCNSGSITGPEDFVDKCQMSKLQIERRARQKSEPESPKPFSFLYDSSASVATTCDSSSGYSTDMETFSPKKSRHSSGGVLSNYNRDLPEMKVKVNSSRRHSNYIPVIPLTPTKRPEIVEPSSPPKIINIACSSKSRKNLKRLLR